MYTFPSEQFWLLYNFTGSNGISVVMEIRICNVEYLWGLLSGIPQIMVTTNETIGFGGMVAGETFNIYVWEHNGSRLSFRVLAYRDANGNSLTVPVNLCDVEFEVGEAWFEDVTLRMSVRHDGFGYFSLTLEDFVKENEGWVPDWRPWETPYYPNIFDLAFGTLTGALRSVIPKSVLDIIDTVYGYGGMLVSFISGVVAPLTSMLLPVLPVFVIFWFVDAVVTAVLSGDFQPVGGVVVTIYQFMVSVVHAIIAGVQTVYNFIHFW